MIMEIIKWLVRLWLPKPKLQRLTPVAILKLALVTADIKHENVEAEYSLKYNSYMFSGAYWSTEAARFDFRLLYHISSSRSTQKQQRAPEPLEHA